MKKRKREEELRKREVYTHDHKNEKSIIFNYSIWNNYKDYNYNHDYYKAL